MKEEEDNKDAGKLENDYGKGKAMNGAKNSGQDAKERMKKKMKN